MITLEQATAEESAVAPQISIIIVSYNSRNDLGVCLSSLAQLTYPDYEVIVVDNASQDDTLSFLAIAFPWVRVIASETNLGFAAANNLGFAHASGAYLAPLNPDTRVEPGYLDALARVVSTDPQAGLATPKTVMMRAPERMNGAGLDITFTGLSFCRGLGESSDLYSTPCEVFGALGTAFLIRRDVLEDIGGFDESFFLYYEDTDLSLRARLAGYSCQYVPDAVVHHDYRFKFSPSKCFTQERNRHVSLLKTLRWRTLLCLLPLLLLGECIALVYAALHGPEHLSSKLRTYNWLLRNWQTVLTARQRTQLLRRVSDRDLLAWFTYRLNLTGTTSSWLSGALEALVNPMVRLVGLVSQLLVA